jgi:anti-sigma regulatory factor (Ser/Thr protein kinase)
MQPRETAAVNGSAGPAADGVELAGLRATCRRQVDAIDALSAAVTTLRTGAAALRAENVELRADNYRVRKLDRAASRGEAHAVQLPLDVRAPGAARIVVAQCLRDRVVPGVLAIAQLLISELVTNTVLHGRAAAEGVVIVRVRLAPETVRLEVEDPGGGGAIASRAPDAERGGGFGLNLVRAVSERWGFEQASAGRTRVWARLRRTPVDAGSSAEPPPEAAVAAGPPGGGSNGRPAWTEIPAGDRRWTP